MTRPTPDRRPTGRQRRLGPTTAAFVAIALSAPAALAQGGDATKEACVAAYDETQTLRQAGSLRSAREKALACSQEQCPAIVKKDCAQWLAEIEAALPRVSFAVKDAAGQDTSAARVFMDGKLLLERLDAAAVPVDPGERLFRIEIEGQAPREQRVIVREGEKGRVIEVSFAAPAGAADTAAPAPMQLEERGDGGGIPAASWVLGGVGVVGVGLFATFGALGLSEKSDAEDPSTGCAPSCTDDEVDSIRTKFLVADVSLGVGVAAIGAAVIVALVAGGGDEETARSTLRVGAAPTLGVDGRPGGGTASIAGSF